MTKIIISLLILCLILSSAFAVIGTKKSIKNEIDDDFDCRIENLMKHGHMPSLVACIVKNNTAAWAKGYGYSCYYTRKDATLDTVYPIASVTKAITATAIMQLNETGLIGLDDNVSEYLPFDLKNPKYPDVNITFRMLLAHQSSIGVQNIRPLMLFAFGKTPPYDQLNEYFLPGGSFYKSKVWNDYPPGEDVYYSTIGFEILGHLIEQVTHQSYVDYCQEHIFEPLNMSNTSFYFSDFDKDKLASLYLWMARVYLPIPRIQSSILAGGGLKTTISDLSHFLIMHTGGGVYNGVRILKEESVEEMHRAQYPDSYDEGYNHGFGWFSRTTSEGETYGGHGGNHHGARAIMRMRYSDKVGVIYFWNQNSFLLLYFKHTPPEQKEAQIEIEKALFEKADEL